MATTFGAGTSTELLQRQTRAARRALASPRPCWPLQKDTGSVVYSTGTEADHESVYQTLLQVFNGPPRDQFAGSLSDPAYRPEHRILAKIGGRVVSQVHHTTRRIRFGTVDLPMQGMMWVGTLPEFRGVGLASNLIRLGLQRAASTQVSLVTADTTVPQVFEELGFANCGPIAIGQVEGRSLPTLPEEASESNGGTWTVRPWRQVELGDLMRLYDLQYGQTAGSIVRTEDHWRWLIGRRQAHVIWVACRGAEVMGYAFVKDHRILELAADPADPNAMRALLGRIRAEALERAYPRVAFYMPPDHPAMEIIRDRPAGVGPVTTADPRVSVYGIPDLAHFLRAVLPVLTARAAEVGMLPLELGLTIAAHDPESSPADNGSATIKLLIKLDSQYSTIERDRTGRSHLSLSRREFTQLILGHLDATTLLEMPGVAVSSNIAEKAIPVLFPKMPFWRSPLDQLTD